MSSGFDELMSQAKMPDPEEITRDMQLANSRIDQRKQRREKQQEAREQEQTAPDAVELEREALQEEQEPDTGEHGGSSGSGGAGAASVVTGPDPAPERGGPQDDEPEDEPVEDEVASDEDEAGESDLGEGDSQETAEVELDDDVEDEPVDATPAAREFQAPREGIRPTQWVDRARFTHDSNEMKLTRFPRSLVERLRGMIGGYLGDAFAREAAANQLVTAFTAAKLGLLFDSDPNTLAMIQAFKDMEPQLSQLEQAVDRTGTEMEEVVKTQRLMLKRMRSMERSVVAAELGTSFFIADRIAVLPTQDMTVDKAAMDDNRVLRMRDTIRRYAKGEITLEDQRNGTRLQ